MAQTTGAMTWKDAVIEYSTDGSTWNAISGSGNKLEAGGGDRMIGTAHTGEADIPLLTPGKREEITVDVDAVYSELSGESFRALEPLYEAGTALKIRWAPKGSSTGNYRYTTNTGYLKTCKLPSGEYGSGDPLLVNFQMVAPGFAMAAIS